MMRKKVKVQPKGWTESLAALPTYQEDCLVTLAWCKRMCKFKPQGRLEVWLHSLQAKRVTPIPHPKYNSLVQQPSSRQYQPQYQPSTTPYITLINIHSTTPVTTIVPPLVPPLIIPHVPPKISPLLTPQYHTSTNPSSNPSTTPRTTLSRPIIPLLVPT